MGQISNCCQVIDVDFVDAPDRSGAIHKFSAGAQTMLQQADLTGYTIALVTSHSTVRPECRLNTTTKLFDSSKICAKHSV